MRTPESGAHRPALAALVAVAAVTCTGGHSGGMATREPISITTGTGREIELELTHDDPTIAGSVAEPPDRVWEALVAVYEALEVPVDTRVDARRRIGASAWQTRRIAGERMARWVDCGSGLSGLYANTHRVTLSVVSTVEPTDAGSTLTTRIEGTARSLEGTSSQQMRCVSKGTLEALIIQAVRELVSTASAGGTGHRDAGDQVRGDRLRPVGP